MFKNGQKCLIWLRKLVFSFGLAAPQSFLYWTIAQKMPFFPSVNGGDKGRRFSAAARFSSASNLLNQVSSVFGLSLVLNGGVGR